jgi:hypothetical protein
VQEYQNKRNVLKNPDQVVRQVLVRIYNHEAVSDFTLTARYLVT